jgi:hypothetical protein
VKRVLLDENLDRRLKHAFDERFEPRTVAECGWSGLNNGALLRAMQEEFEVLVTLDRNLQYQQSLRDSTVAVVVIVTSSSRRADIEPLMAEVNEAAWAPRPGGVTVVAGRSK